jgi:radical SAM protein with 4Fe4S-binding SPASM domain
MNKMRVSLITNGTLLNKKIINEMSLGNFEYVAVSLEGLTTNTNDYVRGDGTFEQVCNKLSLIFEMNKSNNDGSFVPVILQLCLTKYNIDEIKNSIGDFANKYGIYSVTLGRVNEQGNAVKNKELLYLDDTYKDSLYDLIISINNKWPTLLINYKDITIYETLYLNIVFGTNLPIHIPNCTLDSKYFNILPNGDICKCDLLLNSNIVPQANSTCGNILSNFDKKKLIISPKRKKDGFCTECIFSERCNICFIHTNNGVTKESIVNTCEKNFNKLMNILDKITKGEVCFSMRPHIIFKENDHRIELKCNNCFPIEIDKKYADMLIGKNDIIRFNDEIPSNIFRDLLFSNYIILNDSKLSYSKKVSSR